MKKRIASILVVVLVLVSALSIMAACQTECEKNGHKYNETTGVCSVCGKTNPDFTGGCDNGHKFVNGICSECGKTITSANPNKTIVVLTSIGQNLQEVWNNAVESFEEKYPGWEIDLRSISGGYTGLRKQVMSELQAGSQPDLALCYPDHVANYMTGGKVVDMTKYINSTDTIFVSNDGDDSQVVKTGFSAEEISDFLEMFWDEGKAESYASYGQYGYNSETMLTLPLAKSTEVLFYNKTILDQEGIAVPTTWDELWAACRKLAEKYPDCTPLGYDSQANWLITMCEQNGWGYTTADGRDEDHYLFNNDNVKRWLQDIQSYYIDEKLFTTEDMYGAYTSNLFKLGTDKGCFFCIGSTGGASNQNTSAFEVGVAALPGSKDDEGRTHYNAISQGPSMVMFKTNDSNAEEKQYMTFLFIKELLDPVFQAEYSTASGYSPVRYSVRENPVYLAAIEKGQKCTGTTVDKALYVSSTMSDRFFTSPAFVGSANARDAVGEMITSILKGSDVQGELDAALTACRGK